MRDNNYIITYTGLKFWPSDPRPEDVNIIDIAHALSNICRFGGHLKRFYSVAQHSWLVAHVLWVRFRDPVLALHGLIHDASEAYLGDVVSPLKRQLPNYVELEQVLQVIIIEALGLPPLTYENHTRIKWADGVLLRTEIRDLRSTDEHPVDILETMEEGIVPVMPLTAEQWFTNYYHELRDKASLSPTGPAL